MVHTKDFSSKIWKGSSSSALISISSESRSDWVLSNSNSGPFLWGSRFGFFFGSRSGLIGSRIGAVGVLGAGFVLEDALRRRGSKSLLTCREIGSSNGLLPGTGLNWPAWNPGGVLWACDFKLTFRWPGVSGWTVGPFWPPLRAFKLRFLSASSRFCASISCRDLFSEDFCSFRLAKFACSAINERRSCTLNRLSSFLLVSPIYKKLKVICLY